MIASFSSQRFFDNMRFIGVDVVPDEEPNPHGRLKFQHKKSKARFWITPGSSLQETLDMLRDFVRLLDGAERALVEDIIFALSQESN